MFCRETKIEIEIYEEYLLQIDMQESKYTNSSQAACHKRYTEDKCNPLA